MSHPQPPQRQPTVDETQRYANALHNTAIFTLLACPAIALIPPRKLDFFTFGLGGATVYSANFLIRERTGRSIYQHLGPARNQTPVLANVEQNIASEVKQVDASRSTQHTLEELRRPKEQHTSSPVTEEVKNAREAWKDQRQQEIQDDLDVGKGIGEMITGQIWEVWNWGKKSDDDDED